MISSITKNFKISDQTYEVKSRLERNRFIIKLIDPSKKVIPNLSLNQTFLHEQTWYIVTAELKRCSFKIRETNQDGIDLHRDFLTLGSLERPKKKKKVSTDSIDLSQDSTPTDITIKGE